LYIFASKNITFSAIGGGWLQQNQNHSLLKTKHMFVYS